MLRKQVATGPDIPQGLRVVDLRMIQIYLNKRREQNQTGTHSESEAPATSHGGGL